MGLISLFFNNPLLFILLVPILLYSVILHEVAHGYVAYLFGDETALRHGRLTLNPGPHIDPIGLLCLFLIGFGWARPVPVNYLLFSHSRPGLACVSLAGCATNILLALLATALLEFDFIRSISLFSIALPIAARINIILGAFNLIPIPPLDGSKIVMSLLPAPLQARFLIFERYGFLILIVLLFSGLLNPVIRFIESFIYRIIAFLFHLF